jgi:hypothetical protein
MMKAEVLIRLLLTIRVDKQSTEGNLKQKKGHTVRMTMKRSFITLRLNRKLSMLHERESDLLPICLAQTWIFTWLQMAKMIL